VNLYRALLRVYRALLNVYRALLSVCTGLFWRMRSNDTPHVIGCTCMHIFRCTQINCAYYPHRERRWGQRQQFVGGLGSKVLNLVFEN